MSPHRGNKAQYGKRLPRDIYDAQGILLLRAGETVQKAHWIPRLRGEVMGQEAKGSHYQQCEGSATRLLTAQTEDLKRHIRVAGIAKHEAVEAVESVFERMRIQEEIDAALLKSVVTTMVGSLVNEPKALLSLTLIKDADSYTYTHCVNVSVLAMCLAMQIGCGLNTEEIGIGGLVHDIGKIDIPSAILHKPGPLSKSEVLVMRQHPIIGARLLSNSEGISPVSVMCAKDHHENVNGLGYPARKRAHQICPQAQIIAIADVYDALTTDRPYRAALSPAQALALMTQKLADLFAPDLLNSFVNLIGYYPVGLSIELANGCGAVVLQNDPEDPSRPALVQTLTAPDGSAVDECQFYDLRVNSHLLPSQVIDDAVVESVVAPVRAEMLGFEAFA